MILLATLVGLVVGFLAAETVARRRQSATSPRAPQPGAAPPRSDVIRVTVVDAGGLTRSAAAVTTHAASTNGVLQFAAVGLGSEYADAYERALAPPLPREAHGEETEAADAGRALPRHIATRAAMAPQLNELDVARFARIQMLGELAASLAHELGQPLSAIRSNAQAARRFLASTNPPIDEVRAILDDIDADDQRAGEVIHGMRALLQHHQVDMELVDLNVIVRGAARLVHGDCVLRRVAIVLDLDEPLPPVHCDRIQIQQVLLNLIVNAFAAMRDTGQRERRLIVRTRAECDGVTLSVHDAGTGIAPQHLAKLFDQFFTTKTDGLGVGLSIARSIVAAHGGRIWATNNSDCGATFHVVLPYATTARGQ